MNRRSIPATMKILSCGLLVLSSLVCAATGASTNSFWFTRVWRTDDGLPNNRVDAITQGADGYLWVGTPRSLVRFDGIHFSEFPAGGGENERQGIRAISPDRAGGLWIVPAHGRIFNLDAEFSRVLLPDAGLPKNMVSAMVEDGEGFLWIAFANGIYQFKNNVAKQLTTNDDVPEGTISANALVTDRAGNVWLAKGRRIGVFRDGRYKQFAMLTGGVARLAAARSNGVWVVAGVRLYKCDVDGNLQDLGTFPSDAAHTGGWVLMEDHRGAIWIGTDGNGLFRYDGVGFEKIETSHPYILCLAEDREGNIWVGTAGGGLDRISHSGVGLEGWDSGSGTVAIQSICQDTNGVLWGVTQNGLLVSRLDGEWTPVLTDETAKETVTCVAADAEGGIWFGTQNRTLHRWRDRALTTWNAQNGFESHTVVALLPASNGDLWVDEHGNPNAIQCLRDGQLRTLPLPGDANTIGRITAVAEDAAGTIWFGSIKGVLMRVTGDQLVIPPVPFTNQPVLCLYATADGALWIGYEGWGLGRLKDGKFSRIGTEQGLGDDYISQIIADDQNYFWFGSERGIFKIRRDELDVAMDRGAPTRVRSVPFGRNEGLASMEADSANVLPNVSPNAFRSRDGHLWIPMRTAIAEVDPAILDENPAPLPALLTQVTVDGRSLASYGYPGGASLKAQNILLPPGHRHLEFNFTALNFSSPENVRFRYKLVGFDNNWIEKETERLADYTRLTAGDYQFQVEARSGSGPWSATPATFAFVVAPFFWQTWWFQLASLLFLISLVVLVVRYVSFRRLRRRLEDLERQRALDKERSRIAKDLHDDLGGNLTEVGLLVKMLGQHQADPGKVEQSMRQITSTVRRVNESLDEIVWAINPRNDTLPNLIGHLGEMTVEFLRLAGLKYEVDLPDHLPPCVLTPEQRHNLFLVVKEALNNIVRHANAGEVRLRVIASEKDLQIIVEDNGRGFDGALERPGADGLKNMRQRMTEIGGECRMETVAGGGARVSFLFPITSK